ncbi:hypothetical protein PACTADRAFT_4949 [Pachysolen tannophilus NRRL Y-2460]|uniref:CCT-theta n=1 Tax=Pachysolen tannophilus NRRL Y-2460 TaxID=669874 RepID=A0A1E4TN38_PACTA|nr:hypothetical protein PACTADRAFT_4949 [Pachysolen tannophilus NRRL Y-2460]
MSLKLPQAPNAGLFKNGYQTYSSSDGAIVRNIQACKEVTSMCLTSIGPCGRNKIIVNHLGKVFITNDAATMLKELDVVHPAVKILCMASNQQEQEMGDLTNFVMILAGELLLLSEKLINLGLQPIEVINGYNLAKIFTIKELDNLVVDEVKSLNDKNELLKIIKPVISSKQHGLEELISELVVDAILSVLPKNKNTKITNFNVDSIRVVKIMGSSLENSFIVKGMVFPREPEGHIKKINSKSKVAVYTCPIDISTTETKGTVLLHNAQEMLDFSTGEEQQLHQMVKEIHSSGVRVVIAGEAVGELALHYLNRFNILVLKVPSKFDLRRICRVCGATPLPRLGAPMPEEAGTIDIVETKEVGGDRVTIFKQNEEDISKTATIVIRGATKNNLDDIERAIDDGINSVKGLLKDPRLLPGAGSSEIELVGRITAYGEKTPGLLQLAIKTFAKSFEVIPRTLAETSGLDTSEVISRLYASHSKHKDSSTSTSTTTSTTESAGSEIDASVSDVDRDALTYGIDCDSESADGLCDVVEKGIFDLLCSKKNAINLACDAACTVLSVDQIIMAKRAGGPVMPQQPKPGNWDQDD